MKTLITDDFYGDEPKTSVDHETRVEAHNIVYGALSFTDSLDDETIAVLVESGVIVRDREVSGPGWQTRIYVSAKGNPPS